MKCLCDNDLKEIEGGSLSMGAIMGIVALTAVGITFIVGVIDGIVRPLKCN